MSEIDVIGHLMDVENQASSLVSDAQTVADKNISDARAKAESLYKEKYEELIKDLDSQYSKNSQKIYQANRDAFAEYQNKIQNLPQDTSSFNNLLETLLFEGKK